MSGMKMRIGTIVTCALMISVVSGCRSSNPSALRYPDYSSRYTRQAREYEEMREKARKEEASRLKKEESARIEQQQQAEQDRKRLEKKLAKEREAHEAEARKLAEKHARAEKDAARKLEQSPSRVIPQAVVFPRPSVAQNPAPVVQKPTPVPEPQSRPSVSVRSMDVRTEPDPEPVPRASSRGSSVAGAYLLKPGDLVFVYLRGIPRDEEIQDVLDENGYITLSYINEVHAAGMTTSELERSIREAYLEAEIYKNISVNVVMQMQSYYVRGEVKMPGRYSLLSGMTLVQAIAAAGGYSEYAQPKKVKLIRGDNSIVFDVKHMEKHPEKDIAIEAEDVIVIPRSVF